MMETVDLCQLPGRVSDAATKPRSASAYGWLSELWSLFGSLNIIRPLLFRVPKIYKGPIFDNYPYCGAVRDDICREEQSNRLHLFVLEGASAIDRDPDPKPLNP